jgi:hypothetical protein
MIIMKMFRNGFFLAVCLMVVTAIDASGQAKTIDELKDDAAYASDLSQKRVSRIKQKFPSSSPEYKKARNLYDELSSASNASAKTIADSIRKGKKPQNLESASKRLNEKGQAFGEYSSKVLDGGGSDIGIAEVVGGLKLFWGLWTTKKDQKRERQANELIAAMKFPEWNDIPAAK